MAHSVASCNPSSYAEEVRRTSFVDVHCPIAQSLEVIGEWWTPMILRDAFFGVRRFDDFARRLGIARNVLADRLDTLVEGGVLEKQLYDEARGRYDYVLTDKGRALWPVFAALRQWGDEWILGDGNEPVLLEHRTCGHTVTVLPTCSRCGEHLDARSVRAVAGPAAPPDTPLPAPGT
jgi:DNA-binding HxlR family transcriptional regulator